MDFASKVIVKAATQEDIPILELDQESSLFQLGYGKYAKLIQGLITEKNSYLAENLFNSSVEVGNLLDQHGFPVHQEFKTASKGLIEEEIRDSYYNLLVIDSKVVAGIKKEYKLDEGRVTNSKKIALIKVPLEDRDLAVKATDFLGLQLAEVGILITEEMEPVIIEVNPASKINLSDYAQDSERIGKEIIDLLAPDRIPIFSILSQPRQDLTIDFLATILQESGIEASKLSQGKNTNFFKLGVKRILSDREVEVALFSRTPTEIEQNGLIYQASDLVLLNGITEKLTADSLLLTEIQEKGTVILNADDSQLVRLIEQLEGKKLLFCSLKRDNLIIQRRIAQGKPAVYLTNRNLVLFDGEDELPIIANQGFTDNKIMSALFAIAAAYSYGLPSFMIRAGLKKRINKSMDPASLFQINY
ncbi:hypothetical protein MWH28_06590 [Natroniella sulfidigena]|uniref:hypothetical protein n=1 Tax=Natroniella sulfidigena TaxID=723921 RepID=UPI00200AE4D6|nr:hypothetical protein [Natroniella sulfidigena]MCK8817039.1 hypothetical protein [Natroniella sulfidigena]